MDPLISSNISAELIKDINHALEQTFIEELGQTALSLGLLKEITYDDKLKIDFVLPSFGLKSEQKIAFAIKKAIANHIDDQSKIDINFYSSVQASTKQTILQEDLADVRNIILVSSGKGGVGKSTIAANLALNLAHLGCKVGLLDADVYGPSIPLMFGLQKAEIKGFKDEKTGQTFMIPPIKHDVSIMSIGFLVDTDAPMVWRGPMIASACMQMFNNVYWGQLDYLIVDMPPGTGDIQLSIAQKINVAGAIIVSTPQDVALSDVIRAKKMFDKVNIPILGLIENMSYFICDGCDKRHEIFSHNGAIKKANELNIEVLAQIPLLADLRSVCDKGETLTSAVHHPITKPLFTQVSNNVVASVVKQVLSGKKNDNTSLNAIKPIENQTEKKRRLTVL